jgi:hypothetical protein
MSSGRAHGIDPDACVRFLLFVPWQTLGVTVVKCGVDTWVLSRGGSWTGRSLALGKLLIRRYLPLSVLVGLLLLTRLPPFACAVAMSTAFADAVATVLSNEMATHNRVTHAAATNFLKFPLFFLLICVVAAFARVNFNLLLVVFGLTSAARLIVLLLLRADERESGEQPNAFALGTQQILNYGLFKNDQLVTGIVNSAGTAGDAVFVYLARFPELISAMLTACAPVLLPGIYARKGMDTLRVLVRSTQGALGIAAIILVATLYGATAAKPMATAVWPLLPAVIMHSVFALPVNYRTYALFREHRERTLLTGLVKANAVGIGISAVIASLLAEIPPAILWVVPAQQAVFLWSTRRVSATIAERQHAENVASDT